MPLDYIEKRQHTRRPLKVSVAFFVSNKTLDTEHYSLGWTVDVSMHGTCIQTTPHYIPSINNLLMLQPIPEIKNEFLDSDIPVQIKGQVVWVNSKNQNFGVKFT